MLSWMYKDTLRRLLRYGCVFWEMFRGFRLPGAIPTNKKTTHTLTRGDKTNQEPPTTTSHTHTATARQLQVLIMS